MIVVALVAAATALLRTSETDPAAAVPFEELHLPKAVNTPGTWSDAEGPDGPLAALGIATRRAPEGLTGERQWLQLFGVSAVDGHATWVTLPGVDEGERGLVDGFALSPDGRWIAWSRREEPRRPDQPGTLQGWAVMDTTTRKVRRFADADAQPLRETVLQLAFSGDSKYLLTSYETPDAPPTRGHRFVAWDVENGTPTVLEEPGRYWLPNIGSAPSGVVWSRGRTVHRVHPSTGRRSSHSLPQLVVEASWGPDDAAFAYIGRPPGGGDGPWRLYAGRSLAESRDRALPIGVEPGQLLGWRDERHVVVGHFRRTVHVVDVVTGDVVELAMAGQGEPVNVPLLAAALWQNPLTEPAEPTGTTDPRRPYYWGGGVLALALGGVVLVRRRQRVR